MFEIDQQQNHQRITEYLSKVANDFTPPLDSLISLKEYSEKLSHHALNVFFSAQKVDVAHAAIYLNDRINHKAFISSFSVLASSRKQGIGRQMMHYLMTLCVDHGMETLWLETNQHNDRALALYQAFGFKIMNNKQGTITMCLSLKTV
jgi:ribosomal protein S18 acetylase RimI-like enzyme